MSRRYLAMAKQRTEVPDEIVARLRGICLALPAAYEEAAWTGTRWMIGKRNFAHVVMIDAGWPPAYVKAARSNGPLVVVTFRVPEQKYDTGRFLCRPFFKPPWWPDIAGIQIDDATDWEDVKALLADSYLALAPKSMVTENRPKPVRDAGAKSVDEDLAR
jgi:hypothetical protein